MPEPVRGSQRYLPGLDGLRAIAVGAVVAYHVGLGWAQGGLLGVGVFFTLSGYLITDLLLGQQESTDKLQLADFWLRRARRLLPALFVMLAVVTAWVTLLDRSQLPAIRGAVVASAGYVSNWWLIAQHSSYFAQFGPPSPLGHLWSLAVEEQFYLIWPWLLWLGLRWRRKHAGTDTRLAAATLLLAAASAVTMALLYRPGYDPTRVYEGTDTRAFALLIGSALAFVWPSRHLRGEITEKCPMGPRRCRIRRARRFRRAGLAHERVLGVPVSRWDGSALARHSPDGGFYRLTRQQVRPDPGAATATLAGRPLLRHLPVAFPYHRADHPR